MTENKFQKGKVTVVGIGNSGVRIVDCLAGMEQAAWLELAAVDTDAKSLSGCRCTKKMIVAEQWRQGQGCGGDVIKGQRSMSRERGRIGALLEDTSLLIVTGGLGGGIGTGGAPAFASEAASRKIPTIFVMTMPFSLEGHNKRRIAEDGVRELLPAVDILLCLPNDLLFSALPAEVPVVEAFKTADFEVAGTVLGVAEIMRCRNLFAADLSDLKSVLNRRKGKCAVGVGLAAESDGLNRCHLALERMLESPFMGTRKQLQEADIVFFILAGGDDMNLGEMKKTLESAEKFIGEKTRLIVGSKTDPGYNGTVQITAIAVKFDPGQGILSATPPVPVIQPSLEPETTPLASNYVKPEGHFEQAELPLQNISKGIFLNTTPVSHNGEDLDIPTYQRRMVVIDKGD